MSVFLTRCISVRSTNVIQSASRASSVLFLSYGKVTETKLKITTAAQSFSLHNMLLIDIETEGVQSVS